MAHISGGLKCLGYLIERTWGHLRPGSGQVASLQNQLKHKTHPKNAYTLTYIYNLCFSVVEY